MGKKQKPTFPLTLDQLEQLLLGEFTNNKDLLFSRHEHKGKALAVFYIPYVVERDKVEEFILSPLLEKTMKWENRTILNEIPVGTGKTIGSLDEILEKIVMGHVFIYIQGEKQAISYILISKEKRNLEKAETESLVLGPKIGFTESLVTNMNIIRWRIRSNDLVLEEIIVGKSIPTEIRLVYMKSIANNDDVQTMRQRIQDIDVDFIEDSTVLKQYIEDNTYNLFPQFNTTELPDRFAYDISQGKVGVLVENSPVGIIAPSTLFSFLESTEDRYMRWLGGSFFRMLRFIAMFFAIIVTPAYVAVVTYQYALIPTQLLISIGKSRAAVPFPPLFEALLLEFLIELLREAGARLPTKVGQTMGIVGGIVIGQAAVEAGLTSNILIIVVAMSALASFTFPNYLMGASVRIIRYPFIFLAGIFGLMGIMLGLCLLIIHLLRLTSLGRPYLVPLYPFRIKDFNKTLFRSPLPYEADRMTAYRPKNKRRFSKGEAMRKRDIDE
ncbi:spore germination protein [Bacillus niameyensis]|uniref:spore germination protein n=1 Tax=Bacillus niameyensis TaxID=1522308 RepID=UPI0009FCAC69|nr:spore germination protein [Bacillus niameyensis]